MSNQLNLRPDDKLLERLDDAISRYGRKSRNEVALEILDTYLPFWEQLEETKLAVLEQQRAGLLEVSQPYMSGRGTKGEVQRVQKDAQAREQKKRNK